MAMTDMDTFRSLWERVRAGDGRAAEELVRHYEPLIRCEARLRMTDPKLARHFDSADICQSVLASLFTRAACGQFDLDRPEDLVCLLLTMTRNKVASRARQQRARPADGRLDEGADVGALGTTPGCDDPARIAMGRDLVEQIRRHLGREERTMADLRGAGASWDEVATTLGGTAEARRKQLARALDRAACAVGLDDEDEGIDG
jgi:RNA polymerase sigma-70 factor (ECF subfamily)